MKDAIVSIDAHQITLSSSLDAAAFGKVNPTRLLDDCGWLATIPAAADADAVTFAEWRFDGTQTDGDGIALFAGTSPGDGKTLRRLFAEGTDGESERAAIATCTALSAAIARGIALGAVGAEGIAVFAQETRTQVLFLPAELFGRCADNAPERTAADAGKYVHKGLSGTESLLFTRAVIAYRALCGTLPYRDPDLSKRQADIFDGRFVPVALMRTDIDATLAQAIDSGLRVSAQPRIVPGERRYVNEKAAARRAAIIAAAERFSPAAFAAACKTAPAQTDALAQQRQAFVRKQTATVRRRRFFRRNRNTLLVTATAVVLAVWAVTSFERENRGLATSKGLTSWETTQALYATIHQANVPHLQEIAKGKKTKNLRQIVSGFYVTNRSRYAMSQDEATVSPAEWLHLRNKTNFWQYGLTHLRIDGTDADSSFAYPVRADKPQPLAADADVPRKNGTTVRHTATYYLVNNDGSARISTNTVTDTVTLTWRRGRWLVTDIASKSKGSFVFTKDFYAAFQSALDATDGDIEQTADLLRATYEWIPTAEELRAGKASLEKKLSRRAF